MSASNRGEVPAELAPYWQYLSTNDKEILCTMVQVKPFRFQKIVAVALFMLFTFAGFGTASIAANSGRLDIVLSSLGIIIISVFLFGFVLAKYGKYL
jgi:hypothetical protein